MRSSTKDARMRYLPPPPSSSNLIASSRIFPLSACSFQSNLYLYDKTVCRMNTRVRDVSGLRMEKFFSDSCH